MKRIFVFSLAGLLSLSPVLAGPPAGVPAGGGARPDFAGSGRPDFGGSTASSGSSSSGYGQSTASSASGERSSVRGSSANAGSFPSSASSAGGQGLSHAAPQAQGTLQALDTAFSEGEISLIREYFTARAHENKPSAEATSQPPSTSPFKKGQKLSASYAAETLPAELLAKLPNRPGLTYLRVGDTILMLAGPDDVIVDIIDASTLTGGG